MTTRTIQIRIVVRQKADNSYSSDILAEAEVTLPGTAGRPAIIDAAARSIEYVLAAAEAGHGTIEPLTVVSTEATIR